MFLHHLSPEKLVHPEPGNSLEIHSNVAGIDGDPAVQKSIFLANKKKQKNFFSHKKKKGINIQFFT